MRLATGTNQSWEAVEEAGGNIPARKRPVAITSLAVFPVVMIMEIIGIIMVGEGSVLFNATIEPG
jgi:hypothetical protein